jgi:hypothetical protein
MNTITASTNPPFELITLASKKQKIFDITAKNFYGVILYVRRNTAQNIDMAAAMTSNA